MTDSFAVHLGGGAYLDANGNLTFGAPDVAQTYQPPGGFKLDTKFVKETFKDLSDILPHDAESRKKWMDWGVSPDVVGFLSSIAGVVGIVASAITIYAVIIGALIKIMDVMTDDEGISPELGKALIGLKNQMIGGEQIARADKMIAMHSEFDGRIDRIKGLLIRLVVEKPTGATRAQIFKDMRDILDELAVPLSNLRDQEWAVSYDAEAYKGRGFASYRLFHQKSDGTLAPVPMHSPNVTYFDYRLGVPMLIYGATSYAAMARIAMPWFRSAGMYAGQLRKTAEAIDKFVIRMQDESISRTEYTAQTIFGEDGWSIFEIPMGGGPRGFGWPSYAVGAFDLVRYNDSFLWDRYLAQFQAGLDTGPRGLFNYRWLPPGYDYLNRPSFDDLAKAANEQAKQDYANMQAATGMFRLVLTATWLRFLSTPPLESQTVTGDAYDRCTLLDESPTTAKSPNIFTVGVIESPATLKRYNTRNRVLVTTQEPGYVPAFRYRVLLRTIDSNFGSGSWHNRDYVGDVWRPEYVPTQGDPRCKRLRADFYDNLVLSEIELYEGPSPASDTWSDAGEATSRATTFDWYVPVVSPWSVSVEDLENHPYIKAASPTGSKTSAWTGGVSIHLSEVREVALQPEPPLLQVMGNGNPNVSLQIDDAWEFDSIVSQALDLEKAERRHVKIEEVGISWELSWTGDQLRIILHGRPQDRPFQAYIVVEETVYSGETYPGELGDFLSDANLREVIHTPIMSEVINQAVMVPDEFFKKESEALREAAKKWHEFLRRFAESRPIGPGDPIEYFEQEQRIQVLQSPSTSTLAATLDERSAFAASEAPEIWEAVLREG
jgi:hypothetical protein